MGEGYRTVGILNFDIGQPPHTTTRQQPQQLLQYFEEPLRFWIQPQQHCTDWRRKQVAELVWPESVQAGIFPYLAQLSSESKIDHKKGHPTSSHKKNVYKNFFFLFRLLD